MAKRAPGSPGPRSAGVAFTSTPRGGALYPPREAPGSREPGGGPSGAPDPKFPRIWGNPAKPPKNPQKGVPRGYPAKAPKPGYRAPARGVDVKPPSAQGPETAEKAKFGQKGQKWPKTPKKALFGDFRCFGGFLAPLGPPGPGPGRGFYINPSRRGPVQARGAQRRPGAGRSPNRGRSGEGPIRAPGRGQGPAARG